MARHIKKRNLEPILSAARTWINDSLVADRSVFSAGQLWNSELIEEVTRAFVDHPDTGEDPFNVKLQRQLAPVSQGGKRLAAEILWALFLFPSNMRPATKREQVTEVWSWSGSELDASHPMLADPVLLGVGSGGQAYHSLRYRELAFALELMKSVKALDPVARLKLFSDYETFVAWIDTVPREGKRQFRHMLRYFAFPDRVERMSSNEERKQVLEGFDIGTPSERRRWSDAEIDGQLLALRQRLEKEYQTTELDYYEPPVVSRWRKREEEEHPESDESRDDLASEAEDEEAPIHPPSVLPSEVLQPVNLILYGPPGTGKTHWIRLKSAEYVDRSGALDYDTWLQETISGYGWRPLIAAVLSRAGGRAHVSELRKDTWLLAKMAQRGRNPSTTANVLWGYLQVHTPEDNPNVAYAQRRPPFLFNKERNGQWSLVSNWREIDEEAATLEETLRNGPLSTVDPVKRYRIVTFHPSFTYEEFIRGIRPVQRDDDGSTQFQVVDGVFKVACDEARANQSKRYAFFIDEINRANVAKVFGELITLIEPDKRAVYDSQGRLTSGMEVLLPGSEGGEITDRPFGVPANLDIYGTMNTADRSIALLNIALRRRFEFKEFEPEYQHIQERVPGVSLRRLLRQINDRLEYFLDRDHRIGHAYFMSVQHLTDLRRAFQLKIIPLLQEYFFDDLSRVAVILSTEPGAPPFVTRATRAYGELFSSHRPEGVPDQQNRYVLTTESSWTEETFTAVYESTNTANEGSVA